MVHAAAVAGLDPEAAWDRTPGELAEYIDAWHERRELDAYMLYNHASLVVSMIAGRRLTPAQAFPNAIRQKAMTVNEIYANCLAWSS